MEGAKEKEMKTKQPHKCRHDVWIYQSNGTRMCSHCGEIQLCYEVENKIITVIAVIMFVLCVLGIGILGALYF